MREVPMVPASLRPTHGRREPDEAQRRMAQAFVDGHLGRQGLPRGCALARWVPLPEGGPLPGTWHVVADGPAATRHGAGALLGIDALEGLAAAGLEEAELAERLFPAMTAGTAAGTRAAGGPARGGSGQGPPESEAGAKP
jgi:hypothetical protein